MLELPLLLAEDNLISNLGVGWAIGGGLATVIATAAVMKYRQGATEKKDSEQDQTIGNLSTAVNSLPDLINKNQEAIRTRLDESDARYGTGMKSLEKTITRKVDGLKEEQAKQATKMAVMQTDLGYLKKSD